MNFLEKIIQIPFRLLGIGLDAVDTFVDSQTEIEESPDASKKDEPSADTSDNLFDPASSDPFSSQKADND
jgi:hypothetical protein